MFSHAQQHHHLILPVSFGAVVLWCQIKCSRLNQKRIVKKEKKVEVKMKFIICVLLFAGSAYADDKTLGNLGDTVGSTLKLGGTTVSTVGPLAKALDAPTLVPAIADAGKELVNQLPATIDAVGVVVAATPVVVGMIPILVKALPNITQSVPEIIAALPAVFNTTSILVQTLPTIAKAAPKILLALPKLAEAVGPLVEFMPDLLTFVPELVELLPGIIHLLQTLDKLSPALEALGKASGALDKLNVLGGK